MKRLLILCFLIAAYSAKAQDVLPNHVLDKFSLIGDVKWVDESGYDYLNPTYSFYNSTKYTFNKQGKLTYYKQTDKAQSNYITKEFYYLYDSLNRLTEFIDINELYGDIQEEYTYSEKGNVTEIKEYNKHTLYSYEINHKVVYDAYNQPKIREEYKNDVLEDYTVYEFTGNNLTTLTAKTSNGRLLYQNNYTYSNGKLATIIVKNDSSNVTENYTYNSKGLLAVIESETYKTEYEYLEFDKKGNWIMLKINTYNKATAETYTSVIYLKIAYYDGYLAGRITTLPTDALYNFSTMDLTKASVTKNDNDFSLKIDEYTGTYDIKSQYIADGNDLFICERNSGALYQVIDYKNAKVGAVMTPLLFTQKNPIWIKAETGSYWLYYNGVIMKGNISEWMGDDLLVYNPIVKRTFLLNNYKTVKPNTLFLANDITSESNAYFRKAGTGYFLYHNGQQVSKQLAYRYLDSNLIVYDSTTNITFLLSDFKTGKVNTIYPADVIGTTNAYLCCKISSNETFYLIHKGVYVANTIDAEFNGYDVIIILDKDTNKKYRIRDYKLMQPGEFKPAERTL